MRGKPFTKKEIILYKQMFIEMYEVCEGTYTSTVAKLYEKFPDIEVSWRNYYYKWKTEDDEFRIKLELIDAKRTAWVENKLFENIEMGNFYAIKFYLQAKAGWSEKTEQTVTHNINEPIKITIRKPDEGSK